MTEALPGPAEGTMKIATIRNHRALAGVVAERIWAAWWRDEGHPLEAIAARLEGSFGEAAVPTTLVAFCDETFLGTVSLVDGDLDERPGYAPWVAALWVEPEHRRHGVGEALLQAAVSHAAQSGFGTLYLCTAPGRAPYYLGRGWRLIEEDVAGLHVLSCRPGHTGT